MAEEFSSPNQILNVVLSATPGVVTEVVLHKDTRAVDIEFYGAGGTGVPSLGQVSFNGTDGQPIGAEPTRPVPANSDWPFIVKFDGSTDAIQSIFLSSAIASAVVVVVSFEAPQ